VVHCSAKIARCLLSSGSYRRIVTKPCPFPRPRSRTGPGAGRVREGRSVAPPRAAGCPTVPAARGARTAGGPARAPGPPGIPPFAGAARPRPLSATGRARPD